MNNLYLDLSFHASTPISPSNLGSTCHKGKVNTVHKMELLAIQDFP